MRQSLEEIYEQKDLESMVREADFQNELNNVNNILTKLRNDEKEMEGDYYTRRSKRKRDMEEKHMKDQVYGEKKSKKTNWKELRTKKFLEEQRIQMEQMKENQNRPKRLSNFY